MADFSITLTVPNGDVQALVDAINWHDPVPDTPGDPPTPGTPRTAAQCRTWFQGRSIEALKHIVRRYRTHLRDQQSIADDPNIT